jgi:glycosyltransferase involved in cell wall biosynthesis
MKIIVNTRLLLPGKLSGIGWFTYHTVKRIVEKHPEHQFIFLFDRKFDEQFIFGSNVIPEVIYPPTRHPILSYIWLEYAIVSTFRKHKPDIFFSPDGFLSLKIDNVLSLPVIHDLNFEYYPGDLRMADRHFYRYFFPKYAKLAKRVITVSEYTKNDIVATYHVSPDKIDVAYNGSNELYTSVSEEVKSKVKAKITNNCDFFIYLGVLVPRKNVVRLLLAYEEFKKRSGNDVKLVIVGQKLFLTAEIEKTYNNSDFKSDIIFTGHLDTNELKDILGSALSLLYVSYFEGFGIPIIEAMNADVPVITSNVTAMPEVAGDAALLIDPFSVESISNAMLDIYNSEKLRTSLIEKGRVRRQVFSWDRTAEQVWQSIEKCVQDGTRSS